MCQQPQDLDHTIKRRLADLYRFPGFQTLASVSAHASRPHALVVHMRRLKKNRDLLLLQRNNTAPA